MSVGHTVSPIKANKQIEVPLGVWTQVEPRIRSGLDPPRGKGAILGDISRHTAKYREYPCTQSIKSTLFGRWQQRCGLSLPVLQQLVKESYSIISSVAYVMNLHDHDICKCTNKT